MLFGISGAQGAGKSTILTNLPPYIPVDNFKVSRHVQKQFGWDSLTNVMNDFETMVKFQMAVYETKLQHDLDLNITNPFGFTFTERTFADIWAYSSLWADSFYEKDNSLLSDIIGFKMDMLRFCEEAQNEVYTDVFLLPRMAHIIDENDPNRASKETADIVYDAIHKFSTSVHVRSPWHEITSPSVEGRVQEVLSALKVYGV